MLMERAKSHEIERQIPLWNLFYHLIWNKFQYNYIYIFKSFTHIMVNLDFYSNYSFLET